METEACSRSVNKSIPKIDTGVRTPLNVFFEGMESKRDKFSEQSEAVNAEVCT